MPAKKSPSKKPITSQIKAVPKKAIEIPRAIVASANINPKRGLGNKFAVISTAVLFLSTVFWAALAAKTQLSNSDQLVNTYLFEHFSTFRDATLPNAHSFLIKWPFFLLIRLLGPSEVSFRFVTILLSVITVMGLAYVLYRIEKRPKVFGFYMLALASALLLVPAQPYAGGILPVNMAMIATRNLEYLLYIFGLVLLIRSPKFKSRGFWLSTLVLTLLLASDKLFFSISLGGALFATIAYTVLGRWRMARFSFKWLIVTLFGLILATGLFMLFNLDGLVHISSEVSGGPYSFVHSLRPIALGVVFGVLGILTNFGANPVFDAQIFRHMPEILRSRVLALGGLSFIVNFATFIFGFILTSLLFWRTLFNNPKKPSQAFDLPVKLSAVLIWSSLAAIGAFIFTDHYHVVDARYLTILLFAVFISAATYTRTWQFKIGKWYVPLLGLLSLSIVFGFVTSAQTFVADQVALADVNQRNRQIADSLLAHPAEYVVGDYWRVFPIKQVSAYGHQKVMPLDNCTVPRVALSSTEWQPDLNNHSFAYLYSLDKSLTNFPKCSLEQITEKYGRPNASILIAGTLDNPKEFLLYYDRGAHRSSPVTHAVQTVLPIIPEQLPSTVGCDGSTTVLNVVAHQDDDILFMNPDILNELKANNCMRTVYITAGDAGNGNLYWLGREQGAESAYSNMLGTDTIWIQRTVKLADRQFITIVNPRGNPRISLIFMRLPDGNVSGYGFKASHYASLTSLESGRVKELQSVDGQSSFSKEQLESALKTLMSVYKPSKINTTVAYNMSRSHPDHSDHIAVGKFTASALKLFNPDLPINYYIGYPVRDLLPNVFGQDLKRKFDIFESYAKHDGAVCQGYDPCNNSLSYGTYLKNQHLAPAL